MAKGCVQTKQACSAECTEAVCWADRGIIAYFYTNIGTNLRAPRISMRKLKTDQQTTAAMQR